MFGDFLNFHLKASYLFSVALLSNIYIYLKSILPSAIIKREVHSISAVIK